jgi:hypothetical protein
MAEWRVGHRQGDEEYELTVGWDDDSFVNGTPEITVRATVKRRDWDEPRSLTVSVGLINRDNGGPDMVFNVGGKEIFGVPLADLFDESQIIDRIPAWVYGGGDPLTGCLIRAGLSAVIGQLIRCKNDTRDEPWYRDRVIAIGSCLRAHVGRIGARAAWRAAKCALKAGM